MNIYVLRHGQTDYNIEGKFQGQVDIKMNEKGEKETDEIAIELRKIDFDVIFSSPLSRAMDTAQKINSDKIIIDKRIIERSFGDLEGKYGIPDYEKNIEKYNIETVEKLTQRVKSFLDEIIKKYKDKKNILIVTHEGIAQVINSNFNKEDLKKFRLGTGKFVKYEL